MKEMIGKDLTFAIVGGARTREEGMWWKRSEDSSYRGSLDGFSGSQLTDLQMPTQTRSAQTSTAPKAKQLHC